MRINVKAGNTEIILDAAERRALVKVRDIAKGLGDHSGGAVWTQFATNVELGIDELLEAFPGNASDKPAKPKTAATTTSELESVPVEPSVAINEAK